VNDEIKAKIKAWAEKREKMPCPWRDNCEGCRFWIPVVNVKVFDPQITVVGNQPPEEELGWKCIFDQTSEELSETHQLLSEFLGMIRVPMPGPRRPR
jgi:hypothetical protein